MSVTNNRSTNGNRRRSFINDYVTGTLFGIVGGSMIGAASGVITAATFKEDIPNYLTNGFFYGFYIGIGTGGIANVLNNKLFNRQHRSDDESSNPSISSRNDVELAQIPNVITVSESVSETETETSNA